MAKIPKASKTPKAPKASKTPKTSKTTPVVSAKTGPRVTPVMHLLRQLAIHFAASQKVPMPTTEIADALGVNRSFIIRQCETPFVARTQAEQRIVNFANTFLPQFKKFGAAGLLREDDLTTLLAGGERPKLGSLADRRAAATAEQATADKAEAVKARKREARAKKKAGVTAGEAASVEEAEPTPEEIEKRVEETEMKEVFADVAAMNESLNLDTEPAPT